MVSVLQEIVSSLKYLWIYQPECGYWKKSLVCGILGFTCQCGFFSWAVFPIKKRVCLMKTTLNILFSVRGHFKIPGSVTLHKHSYSTNHTEIKSFEHSKICCIIDLKPIFVLTFLSKSLWHFCIYFSLPPNPDTP